MEHTGAIWCLCGRVLDGAHLCCNAGGSIDGQSNEVPPNASASKGTLDATYDTASKQLNYTVSYSGDGGAFPRAGRVRRKRRGCRSRARGALEPNQGYRYLDRRSVNGSHKRQMVFQRSYRSQQGRRDPRTSAEGVAKPSPKNWRRAKKGETWKRDLAVPFHTGQLSSKPDRGTL